MQVASEGRVQQVTPVHTILVVEGRKSAAEHLALILNDQGYNVVSARTQRDTWAKVQETHPAVIVLVDSPSLRFSSRRLCDALRDTEIPVLMLLPEGKKIDYSIGAQTYLRYPFSTEQLVNRIVRLLLAPDDELLKAGDLVLNVKHRYVFCGERESRLTPKQALLLQVLMRHSGEILPRAFLMKQVWNTDYMGDTRTLDVHVHCVRKAIEKNPKSPVYLRTVRRVGYCFQVPDEK